MPSFFSFKLHTFTHKVNGSSAYYKVVFLVLLFISWSVVSCPPRIYLSCYLWCFALAGSKSEAGSGLLLPATAAAYIATRHSSTLLSASLFSAILNRRGVGYQLWRGSRWVPLLNHCWVPCWVPLPLLGGIGGCHARAPLPGWHAMGAIAGVPLLGAIVGAMAGCHCSVPLPDASYQP